MDVPREVKKEVADGCIEHTHDEYSSSYAKQHPGPCDSWFKVPSSLNKYCHECAYNYEGDSEDKKEIEELCIVVLDIPDACFNDFSEDDDLLFECSACAHYDITSRAELDASAVACIEDYYESSYSKKRH